MMLLKIYTLEDTEETNVVSTLPEGEHVIGRGATLNCNDKRVSRKHALINVDTEGVTIKAVHVNPCFFKAASGKNITILPKDTSIVLHDGDQFALLADVFWFRVRVVPNNGNILQNSTKHPEDTPEKSKIVYTDEEDNSVNISLPEREVTISNGSTDVTNAPSTSKRCLDENLVEESYKRQKTSGENEYVEPDMTASDKNVGSEEHLLNTLASPTNVQSSLDTSQNVLNKNSSREDNLGAHIDTQKLMNNLKAIVEEDYGSRREEQKKEESNKNGSTCNLDKNNVSDNSVKVKQELTDENVKVKEENVSDSKAEDDKSEDKSSNTNNSPVKIKTEVKEELTSQTCNNEQGEGSSDNANNDQNTASCSTDNQNKKTRRERCWYGPNCYRKNPIHRANLSHPGDDDYGSEPEDDRPTCPFGVTCYRRNVEHRRQFLHLNPPAPKPNGGDGRPKKKRKSPKKKPKTDESGDDQNDDDNNSDDGTTRKKRKAAMKKTYYDSPLDDYDYDDPFLDDASSDEFELSSDDDDDDDTTDWDDSQKVDEESQETRRLLKEAKRFTKGKGKKKD